MADSCAYLQPSSKNNKHKVALGTRRGSARRGLSSGQLKDVVEGCGGWGLECAIQSEVGVKQRALLHQRVEVKTLNTEDGCIHQ